jgi:membrane fusion protein, copper/silver efflux system
MKNFVLGFLAAAILFGGGMLAYKYLPDKGGWRAAEKHTARYHCPMHPTYISDKPGDCPICGMKLAPIEQPKPAAPGQETMAMPESQVPGYAPVMVPAERIESMGITLAEAQRRELDQSIRTYGQVAYDETKVHHIHTKFEGFIEHLRANYVGQYIKQGDPLFSIYSPDLYATENEYLLALRAREQMPMLQSNDANLKTGTIDLVAAARQRLALWDIGENEIREIERTRKPIRALTIFSPVTGFITSKTAQNGLKVSPIDNLYDIVDLSVVWVLADLYEASLPFVRLGQPASVTSPYRPGRTWHGRVVFINPTVDPSTRTVKARIEFANPNNELKPDMYADVIIGGARGEGIAIPENAVISTGERNIVFVATGHGMFEPREVVLGVRVRNLYEIKQGVSEGDKVVTGANFLLDSESKLQAAISSGNAEHKHGK